MKIFDCRRVLFLYVSVACAITVRGQDAVIRLWPGTAPGSETWTQKETKDSQPRLGGDIIRNIVDPTLTIYLPPKALANGTAVIVCPGGAFQFLSWTNEGTEVGKWLNDLGVTVFILKYRVMNTGATEGDFQQATMAMFAGLMGDFKGTAAKIAPAAAMGAADGRKAIEVVRENAAKYGVAADRIGIIGFSAGASVALDATTNHTLAGRPNFTASIYGPDLRDAPVPKDAPPLFLLCASDDPLVPSANSATVYSQWKSGGHVAELHIFTKGGHGFGMAKRGLPVDHWTDLFQQWLQDQGFLKVL